MIIKEHAGITVPHFCIGTTIKVKLKDKNIIGKIKFVGKNFITIQSKNYQQAINYTDIITGAAIIIQIKDAVKINGKV